MKLFVKFYFSFQLLAVSKQEIFSSFELFISKDVLWKPYLDKDYVDMISSLSKL